MRTKSYLVQFLLTFFFGPIGLFYSSVAAAICFIIMGFGIGIVTFLIGSLLVWPASILAGFVTVRNFNEDAEIDKGRFDMSITTMRGMDRSPDHGKPEKKLG